MPSTRTPPERSAPRSLGLLRWSTIDFYSEILNIAS